VRLATEPGNTILAMSVGDQPDDAALQIAVVLTDLLGG
jgi:hypothetical protein